MKHFDAIKETVGSFYDKNPQGVVIIWGATATGKTSTSVKLSKFFDFEVISCDSRQIFRHMNIGTDKISQEIRSNLPHHQIDIIDPDGHYTAGQRQKDTIQTIDALHANGQRAMVVGGTGLYIDTLYKNFTMPDVSPDYELRNYLNEQEKKQPGWLHAELERVDPVSAAKIHPHCTRYLVRAIEIYKKTGIPKSEACRQLPVRWPLLMIGLWRNKKDTNHLIDRRIKEMIKEWLEDEVKNLLAMWFSPSLQSMQGIGYKETVSYLQWKRTRNQRINDLRLATHSLAKKQRTRFRRYIRDGQNNPKENVQYHVYELEL